MPTETTPKHAAKTKPGFKPFLEGTRLYLREVRPSDVTEDYYAWLNDAEVGRHLETRFRPQSKESIEGYVRHMLDSDHSVFFAIVEKASGRHIGNIKIGPINAVHRFADVALIVGDKASWGKGYATEAISLVTDWGFKTLNLNKCCASIYAVNKASLRAFEKAGYKVEGTLVAHRFVDGKYIDELLVAKIRGGR